MSYQYSELVHWFKNPNKNILPASVDIDLTNICNQDCYYCNTAEFRKSHPVQQNYLKYISLLDKLASWRKHSPDSYGTLHTVAYGGGGEPTLLKNYEKVIEHTVDLGFLTGIITNGTNLNKIIDNIHVDKIQKLGWIGVDIDAGTEQLYEKIRRGISKKSIFNQVISQIKQLTEMKANVDIKILLGEYNHNLPALHDIFNLAKKLKVRQIFFRPVVDNNGVVFSINELVETLEQLSKEYNVKIKYNLSSLQTRNYSRCHQMFQFPTFSADGYIYTCCVNKGNPQFRLGSWVDEDFRDIWIKEQHMKIYNTTNTKLCPPCPMNNQNNSIQDIIDHPDQLETLYY